MEHFVDIVDKETIAVDGHQMDVSHWMEYKGLYAQSYVDRLSDVAGTQNTGYQGNWDDWEAID